MKRFSHCNNCGSDDLEWMSTHQSDSGVQDGVYEVCVDGNVWNISEDEFEIILLNLV